MITSKTKINRAFIFSLNDTECISITLHKPHDIIHCCYEIPLFFIKNKEKILLSKDSIRELIEIFNGLLKKALLNNLKLPASISTNIGYLFNKEINEEKPNSELQYEKCENGNSWVGWKYKIWSYLTATWIYNDELGNIILEITPVYPKTFRDPEEDLDIENYQNWMKSYAPILIRTIPRNIAENWLKQTENILEEIKANIKMLQEKNKF